MSEDRQSPSALDRALRLLGSRPHFRAEIERKLRQKGHAAEEIDAALERLSELGYLNDLELARAEAERLRQRKGLARGAIGARLRRQGAEPGAVDAALDAFTADDESAGARLAAARWLGRHRPDATALARHLDRKGYAKGVILGVLEELRPEGAGVDAGGD